MESMAGVQLRKELVAKSILIATDYLLQSTGTVSEIHQAAAVTTGTIDADDIYPNFDTACSSMLTNSMRNCREVEEHVAPIMQAESGCQRTSARRLIMQKPKVEIFTPSKLTF